MSHYASSSKATLDNSYELQSFLSLTDHSSSISNVSASSSHWLHPTTSITKPKPIKAKRSARRLGYHPPYQIGDTAYLRYDSTSRFDEYIFRGTHVSPLSTERKTYFTSVFESSNLGHTRYAIDVEEDHRQDRCWYQAPKFFVWFRTLFCAFI